MDRGVNDPEDELRKELTLLRAAVAKNLRIQVESGKAPPAVIEAARKFLTDQNFTLRRDHNALDGVPRQASIVTNLPFNDDA